MTRIVSTGIYLPRQIVTNDFFRNEPDMGDLVAFGKFMTGMKERRHASPDETGVFMAVEAANQAIDRSEYSVRDIELVIGFIGPGHHLYPDDINLVAKNLGTTKATIWSVNTACSSFLTCLVLADSLIRLGEKKVVLIVCSTNCINTVTDKTKPYSMFGDGAGAIMCDDKENCLIAKAELSDPRVFHTMQMKSPVFTKQEEYLSFSEDPNIDMIEEQVLKPIEVAKRVLNDVDEQPDWFLAHQSGIAFMETWRRQLKIKRDRLIHTFDKYANMYSANIPITLDYYTLKDKKVKRGDTILFYSPGAGAHYVAVLWRY